MKKNLLSAIVIFFVTFTVLLVVSEMSKNSVSEDEMLQHYTEVTK